MTHPFNKNWFLSKNTKTVIPDGLQQKYFVAFIFIMLSFFFLFLCHSFDLLILAVDLFDSEVDFFSFMREDSFCFQGQVLFFSETVSFSIFIWLFLFVHFPILLFLNGLFVF